jgi:hypothetical protein
MEDPDGSMLPLCDTHLDDLSWVIASDVRLIGS